MDRTNRQWVLAARPVGMVEETNFELREEPVAGPGPGEVLARTCYVSFDPAMRGWMEDVPSYLPPVAIGEVMRAATVLEVVESGDPSLAPGDLVQGFTGWQEYATAPAATMQALAPGVSPTDALSVLGTTGLTAYFGLLDVGEPREGDTVLVSGAAGATGSVAAQIAKVKGCRVVGIVGGPEKCAWLTDRAKLDGAIDYKADDVEARIGELCPQGVDVYFDNVGGEILEAALEHMNDFGRVVMCGAISGYNDEEPSPAPRNLMNAITRRLRLQGFIVIDFFGDLPRAIQDLSSWLADGSIVHEVDVQHGFENIPATFLRLFDGRNTGKQLLELAAPGT